MHLVSLEVKGLKSLRDTRIEELDSHNVFIGKNDSGKSSILQVLRLLQPSGREAEPGQPHELVSGKPERGRVLASLTFRLSDDELAGYPDFDKWRDRRAIERVRNWRYDLEMRVGHRRWADGDFCITACGPVAGEDFGRVFCVDDLDSPMNHRTLQTVHLELLVRVRNQSMESLLDSTPTSYWSSSATAPALVFPDRGGSSGDFYWPLFHKFVGGISHVDPTRRVEDELTLAPELELKASGTNLTRVLSTLERNDRNRYRLVLDLARSMFPRLADVHWTLEGQGTVLRIADSLEQEPLAAFRLSQVGTGVQQALVILTSVLLSEKGSTVLLEEPENNLHPGAQRVLSAFLSRHAIEADKQILITTHSTIFASNEEHCSTYLVRLDEEEGTKVTKLEAGHQPLVKEELGIRNVDLYGYNGVVLWEGDSEDQAMPLLLESVAKKVGTSVHALGLTSRNLRGKTNVKVQAVREFLCLLDTLDVVPYVVMDDDQGVREELDKLVQDGLLPEGHYHVWEQGRKMHGRNPGVGCEFEDNFSDEQLVGAAMAVAQDAGVPVELSVAEFAKWCAESSSKTSDVLCKYYWEKAEYGLPKPELNRRVADLVVPELSGDAARTVKEYEFEKVARDIFRKLGGFDVEETSDLGG
jgi:predicted ATPase